MKKRIVDLDALLKTLYKYYPEYWEDVMEEFPTLDAVPVVRCRDCKWWVKEGNDSFGYAMFCDHDCSLGGQGIKKPDDYCSYGERKEQNDETVSL